MCGITGIYEYGRAGGDVSEAVLAGMRDTLRHRGPDDEGISVSADRRVGLAHVRLAIVDVAGGKQPMVGERGEVLVFNGEIYNYPALRSELESDGVRFSTTCDTEVILKLYTRLGRGCLERLDGMFAFALWDPAREELFFARDRIGEKPFYWADAGGRFVFGSEIKALLAHPGVSPEVNEAQIAPFLTNLVSSSPETLYRGIFKLPPGTAGVCDGRGVETFTYWDATQRRTWREDSFEDAATKVRGHLDRSVSERLMSDVPVGVLLSGGLDSSTILALLREQGQTLDTFSVGFDGRPGVDETEKAARVARHFGTEHSKVTIGAGDAAGFLGDLVHHQDEPLADPVCIPFHFVCRLARRQGVKVVMAGEGADELFWGYPRYTQLFSHARLLRSMLALPAFMRAPLPLMAAPLGRARYEESLEGVSSPLGRAHYREFLEGVARGRPLPAHMPLGAGRREREHLLGVPQDPYTGWSPPAGSDPDSSDPMSTLAWDTQQYEFAMRLPELLLMRMDRFSMSSGVESRVPFLDPALVEYVYSLPVPYKVDGPGTKLVLREAVRDILPSWVLDRPKQGFGAPISDWLAVDLKPVFNSMVESEAVQRYFVVDEVRRAFGAGTGRNRKPPFWLWFILNFALWHRYWIEGESLDDLRDAQGASLLVGATG